MLRASVLAYRSIIKKKNSTHIDDGPGIDFSVSGAFFSIFFFDFFACLGGILLLYFPPIDLKEFPQE